MSSNNRNRLEVAKRLIAYMEDGGDAYELLKAMQYGNPKQAYTDTKKWCRLHKPDLYERFPNTLKGRKTETPEEGTAVSLKNVAPALVNLEEALGPVPETPEAPKMVTPAEDDFEMLSIRSKKTDARYEYSKEYDLICIKARGDELTLSRELMLAVYREFPTVCEKLGVKL